MDGIRSTPLTPDPVLVATIDASPRDPRGDSAGDAIAPSSGFVKRRMVRAELLGRHTHATQVGISIHIWIRNNTYIARGRLNSQAFGETLGSEKTKAERRLHQLVVELENRTYQRPSDSRRCLLRTAAVPSLSIRELSDRYLREIRRLRGKQTAVDYRTRLLPTIEFAEGQQSRRHWPLAANMDRNFAIELRKFLYARQVTGNGHSNAVQRTMSPRQIYNVLDCLRSMLNWARRPDVHAVPSTFVNPFTWDIVGERPRRDPFAATKLPLVRRMELVARMDLCQLTQLGLALVLPLRPDELTGLLVSDVDLESRLLHFRTRFGGRDYNKGRQSFRIPLPPELDALLRHCIGARLEGPLLRTRKMFGGTTLPLITVNSRNELMRQLDLEAKRACPGSVQTEQDAKVQFRRLLVRMGGLSTDALGKEFRKALGTAHQSITIRDLRSSISTEMNASGMSHLALRYLTGHTTSDIMNSYVTIDLHAEAGKYFQRSQALLEAVRARVELLECRV